MSGFVITEMWAVTVTDEDGEEGVPAMLGPDGVWFPLVAADPARLDSIRAIVHGMILQGQLRAPVFIKHFTEAADIEIVM